MPRATLKELVRDFVDIAETEIKEGVLTVEERFTPEMLVECLPFGTSLEQVYEILNDLGQEGKVKFSHDPSQPVIGT